MLRSKEPNTSEAHVRLEHDALLDEISQDLEQLEEVGGNINKQLADIVNKRWSSKLTEAKQKEKMDNYPRPGNCERFAVPRVNEEIWGKLDNKTKHNDLRATSTQKLLAKVGTILTITTDKLLQMHNADLPEVDQIITMNTDALALLGHTCVIYLCVDATLSSPIYTEITAAYAPHMCQLHLICLAITYKHSSMTLELQIKLENRQSLSGMKNPDHKAVLGLGAPVPSTLKENKEGGIFYPTAGSGSTIPQEQLSKPRSTQ